VEGIFVIAIADPQISISFTKKVVVELQGMVLESKAQLWDSITYPATFP
jgi:hypothetical protein